MEPTEASRRITDAVGKATNHLLLAENHVHDILDVLRAADSVNESHESSVRRYLRILLDQSCAARVQIIEIGEHLVVMYGRQKKES